MIIFIITSQKLVPFFFRYLYSDLRDYRFVPHICYAWIGNRRYHFRIGTIFKNYFRHLQDFCSAYRILFISIELIYSSTLSIDCHRETALELDRRYNNIEVSDSFRTELDRVVTHKSNRLGSIVCHSYLWHRAICMDCNLSQA